MSGLIGAGRLFAALLIGSMVTSAIAAPKTVSGTIKTFECGDNCYLTVRTKAKQDLTGLCMADACQSWNEQTEIPKRLIGKKVRVTVGKGQQVDADGNVMGDYPAFTRIEFVK